MSVPFQKIIVVIDTMAFRRAWVESFLVPWAKHENAELISLQPEKAHAKLVERRCDMLIYNVGAALLPACDILTEIQVLRTLCPAAALVILSDDTSLEKVISTIYSGAQGYLSNSMAPDLALQALSFVLHGGTYFPPAILASHVAASDAPTVEYTQNSPGETLRRQPAPAQMSIAGTEDRLLQQQGSLFDEPAPRVQLYNISAVTQSNSISKPEFTERQHAVLSCLCRGDPNKAIGRRLGMTETTVKVHVREIMRKLGVHNRTQVAIAASRIGLGSDSVVELISGDSPTTMRSSGPH